MTTENINNVDQYPDEINLKEIAQALFQSKLTIILFVVFFAIGSITYSLMSSEKWTSSALLLPVSAPSGGGSASGIASLAGVKLSKGSAGPSSKASATIRSRDFLKHLLSFQGVLKNIMAFKAYDPETKTSIFSDKMLDPETGNWNPDKKPTPNQIYLAYQSMLEIKVDKLEGFVTISIRHGSPIFAKEFLELIITEINNLSRQRDLDESEESLVYLYNQLDSVQQSDVQLAVSQLIESQLKKQMMANVKSNYILQPIDSPFIPELRTSPQRTKIVISWTLIGFILSIIFIIFRHYSSKFFK